MVDSRTATRRWRELAALVLQGRGVPSARQNPLDRPGIRFADAFPEDEPIGDIVGIPGWVVNAHNERQHDFSGQLDKAARDAKRAGVTRFASLQYRRDREPDQAFVVMPLSVFCEVLAEQGTKP